MLQSSLYVFKVSTSEDITTVAMIPKTSDVITLEAAGLGDGHQDAYFVVSVNDDDDAAGGLGYQVSLEHCDTETGTYESAISKVVSLASIVTGAEILKAKLPFGLKKYVRVGIKSIPSLGGIGEEYMAAAAASDSAAKVAGLIRTNAALYLPDWVVTGATVDAIFTADAVGVRSGKYIFDGMSTGITGTFVETTAGEAAVKAVWTLTVNTACALSGNYRILLNQAPMTGDAHFNAAIVTG